MKVLLGKFNNGKICVSAIAVGLIVLICAVIIQAPIKGRAADSNYYILYKGGKENIKNVISFEGGDTISDVTSKCTELGMSFTNNTNTLTFNGTKFTTTNAVALKITSDVTINLMGENSIISTSGVGIEIINGATVTFTGSGTLTVNGVTYGINSNGNLVLNHENNGLDKGITVTGKQGIVCNSYTQSSGTVNVTSKAGVGIQATNAIKINGGTATVNSIDGKGINSIGDISVSGSGTVDIIQSQYGITTDGKVNISKGNVKVNSNGSGTRGGITSAGGVNITGGDVQVTTLSTDGKAYGISDSSSAGIVISGGNVNVNTTTQRSPTSEVSVALSSKKVDISSGTTTINVNGVKAQGINVSADGDGLSISGEAQVKVEGDIQGYSGYDQSAVYVDSTMNVSGGSLSVDVTNKKNNTYITGITTTGDLIVNGGEVTSKVDVKYGDDSSNTYGESDGILVEKNLQVNGGIIKGITNGQENGNASGIHTIQLTNIISGEVYVENNNPSYASVDNDLHGIFAEGGFTMSGGTFTAKGISSGIFANRQPITDSQPINITGGVITVSTKKAGARAIYTSNTVTIENGDLILTSEGNNSYGIYSSELVIGKASVTTGPTITINKTTKDKAKVYNGIYSSGDMTIYGGNIEIEIGGTSARGIGADSNLTIGNSDSDVGPTISVKGDIKNDSSDRYDRCGIYVDSAFTVNSGNITVNLKNSQDTSYITGIYANSTMNMAGGNIEVNIDSKQSDDTYGHSDGMVVKGAMTLDGGKVVSKTNGASNESAGIHVNSMTVNGGKAEFRNTNVLDIVGASVKRIGLYSDYSVTISGGYVIAQGMEQATLLNGTPNISYSAINTYYSVTTLVTTDYNGANLSIYNSSNDINSYKYVEFGKQYKNYIRYNVASNEIHLGDGVLNITDNQELLNDIGISILSQGKLKINNMNFISQVEYGLKIEGTAIIVISDNSDNTIYVEKDIADKNEYGIYCTGNLTFEGKGTLNVTGYTQAISASNVEYISGTDYELKPTGTGEEVTHTVSTKYPSSPDYTTAKYIEIGPVANYYLEYNASTGKMYKAINDSNKTPINNNELVYGWSIAGDKTLVLDGFNFETCASTGLKIVGAGNVNVSNANSIVTLYDSKSSYTGIATDGNITLQGIGTLNLKKYEHTTDKYTGIVSSGNVTIEGGTYNINGEKYGIQATGNTLAISNAYVIAKGETKAIDVGSCNIHAKVEGSNSYDGANKKKITDINKTYTGTYASYKYFDISPATITVNITWGSMEFTGQRAWEPSTHDYIGAWSAENDGDKIQVENTTTSNIPIYAKVIYTQATGENTALNVIKPKLAINDNNLAVGSDTAGPSSLTDGQSINVQSMLDIGKKVINTLSLSGMPAAEITSSTNIGNVSVILSDYQITD